MERFVAITTMVLHQVYEKMRLENTDTAGAVSALEILPYQRAGIY
jgi:hypothetical protein